ncbi:MAG: 7-cyano-7-deazaguanine synthase QueC [Gammaproteobacteria bacterium]|nr:7-cyano-7-deazaguanine synthase QueC [Gammaproteobacteria bacterium]
MLGCNYRYINIFGVISVENNKKAIVLFSGGLDSSTALIIALSQGYQCIALTINYKQRHSYEIVSSKIFLKNYKAVEHIVYDLDLSMIEGSALTDNKIDVPKIESSGIPVTYVPARNTLFLSIASSFAESKKIKDIFIGVNAIDYSGYPDCRPEFIKSFEEMINKATKYGLEHGDITIHTPLIELTKAEIIKKGTNLGIDYSKTVSCYSLDSDGSACGVCDSCRFRKQGFQDAGIEDPTIYK